MSLLYPKAYFFIIYYISSSVNFTKNETLVMPAKNCPICIKKIEPGKQGWHFVCPSCQYEMAALTPSINQTNLHQPLDESARETGLRTIRNTNFKKLLNRISIFTKGHKKLLDVGCAHGWFLEIAKNQFDVLGIEPDKVIFNQTAKTGLSIRLGYFPEVLNSEEKFDIIIFNDVIEHIPDIQSVLNSCHKHLNKNGLLVLNLPNSKGIFI